MKTVNLILLFGVALIVAGCARIESATAPSAATEPIQTNKATADKAPADKATANQTTANKAPATNGATVQKMTPDALIKDLYRRHDNGASPFDQTKNRALVDKYFAQPLAELIWQDAKKVVEDESDVDPDQLYDNGQDSVVKNFAVGQPTITADEAVVTASHTDYGKKRTVTFRLVREDQNWKIADIRYTDGNSLLDFYRSKTDN